MRIVRTLLLLMLFSGPLSAAIEAYSFDDKEQEARYKDLIEELRCLVCQNQNLADSNAELALDLRRQTYDMVQDGKSKDEVVDYMVTRYGDFVLYRPPFNISTILLWVGPFVILIGGIWILAGFIRARPDGSEQVMSAEEHQRMAALLETKQEDNHL